MGVNLVNEQREKTLFSTEEAAEYLGVHLNTVKYHHKAGRLPSELIGNSRVFKKADLDRFQETKQEGGQAQEQPAAPESPSKQLYSLAEAAEYLGMDINALKYHAFTVNTIFSQLIGNARVFWKADLDHFQANKRGIGRPRGRNTKRVRPYTVEGETVYLCSLHSEGYEAIGNATYANKGEHRCRACVPDIDPDEQTEVEAPA